MFLVLIWLVQCSDWKLTLFLLKTSVDIHVRLMEVLMTDEVFPNGANELCQDMLKRFSVLVFTRCSNMVNVERKIHSPERKCPQVLNYKTSDRRFNDCTHCARPFQVKSIVVPGLLYHCKPLLKVSSYILYSLLKSQLTNMCPGSSSYNNV